MTQTDGSAPLVSVVTPCYNAEGYVAETVASVLAQSHAAVEQIVVDDASSDGSWAVVERLAARHPDRVRAVRVEENRGGSHARNRGAELARGEFLMFLDADDLIAPDTLERLVEAARDRPAAIAVCDWKRIHQRDGRWVEGPPDGEMPSAGGDNLADWLEGRWVPTCSVLWRRDAFALSGGWDESLRGNDDGDVMMRALARGARLVRAAGGTSYYRTHGDGRFSLSGGMHFSEGLIRDFVRVLEKLEAELSEQGRLPRYARSLGIAYYRLPVVGFLETRPELAREILARAERLAGPEAAPAAAMGRTLPGRVLSRLLGVEGKERILRTLARFGVMTPQRRRYLERRARFEQRSGT